MAKFLAELTPKHVLCKLTYVENTAKFAITANVPFCVVVQDWLCDKILSKACSPHNSKFAITIVPFLCSANAAKFAITTIAPFCVVVKMVHVTEGPQKQIVSKS